MIAVLFCDPIGTYADIPGLDLWGLPDRDALTWPGGSVVIAHPPCTEYSRAKKRALRRTEPCFAFALECVRREGGVIEHPAGSSAYRLHGLTSPGEGYGWQRNLCGGWTCTVWQHRYGHFAPKATWLYLYGTDSPPHLAWGPSMQPGYTLGGKTGSGPNGRRRREHTPRPFAEMLVSLVTF